MLSYRQQRNANAVFACRMKREESDEHMRNLPIQRSSGEAVHGAGGAATLCRARRLPDVRDECAGLHGAGDERSPAHQKHAAARAAVQGAGHALHERDAGRAQRRHGCAQQGGGRRVRIHGYQSGHRGAGAPAAGDHPADKRNHRPAERPGGARGAGAALPERAALGGDRAEDDLR